MPDRRRRRYLSSCRAAPAKPSPCAPNHSQRRQRGKIEIRPDQKSFYWSYATHPTALFQHRQDTGMNWPTAIPHGSPMMCSVVCSNFAPFGRLYRPLQIRGSCPPMIYGQSIPNASADAGWTETWSTSKPTQSTRTIRKFLCQVLQLAGLEGVAAFEGAGLDAGDEPTGALF